MALMMNLQQNYKTHQLYQIYVEIFVNQVIRTAALLSRCSSSRLINARLNLMSFALKWMAKYISERK